MKHLSQNLPLGPDAGVVQSDLPPPRRPDYDQIRSSGLYLTPYSGPKLAQARKSAPIGS